MVLEKKKSSSKSRSATTRKQRPVSRRPARVTTSTRRHFVICVRNDDYRASLELRKLYEILEDDFAERHDLMRVIDESGEDYLYPANYFVRVNLPTVVARTLQGIA